MLIQQIGQGHSNARTHDDPNALVKHHYHASLWPSRHPRYSHPAYGMVEECNWNPECVATWDANHAAFPSLSEEEQARLIEAHQTALLEKDEQEAADKAAAEKEEADRKQTELFETCAEQLRGLKTQGQEKADKPAVEPVAGDQTEKKPERPAQEANTQSGGVISEIEKKPETEAQEVSAQSGVEAKETEKKPSDS